MADPFLFFGITLPLPVRDIIDEHRVRLGLDRRYTSDRFHITLRSIGLRRMLSPDHITAVRMAASSLIHPPFHVVFNLIDHGVLIGGEPILGLRRFERALSTTLTRHAGLAERDGSFRPHVTLVYGGAPGRHAIDGISWLVEDFALIESLQGDSRHRDVERWRLRG